jgi:hypothetical protein
MVSWLIIILHTNQIIPMRKYQLVFIILILIKISAHAQYVEWGKQFGPDYRGIQPTAITSDNKGNAIVIGRDQTGMTDISGFVKRYNANGALLMAIGFNDNNSCHSLFQFDAVAADLKQNTYVLGSTQCSELQFQTYSITDTINFNIGNFLLKIDSIGHIIYLIDVPEGRTGLDIDTSGNCYLVGNNGVQKYNKLGVLKWNQSAVSGNAIDVASNGRIFITNGTSSWKLNTIGNITWQNNTVGGLGISYHEEKNKLYLISNSGTTQIKPLGNNALPSYITNLVGSKIFCDSTGNLYANGNGKITKKMICNSTRNINSQFVADFTVSKNGMIYSLGIFNNRQNQVSYCNFTSILQGQDPNIIGSDDGYIAKISFDNAPFEAIYKYTSACLNQVNPISHCTDRNFNSNNTFRVELSNDKGSFSNPIYVGPENNVVLPNNLPSGDNYKFRIKSTSPVLYSTPSLPFEILPYQGSLTISKIGAATLCDSGYVHFRSTDINGIPVISDWYADVDWNFDWKYQSTGTDFIATLDGNYYASSTVCYNVSNNLDADHNCRVSSKSSNEIEANVFPNPSSEYFSVTLKSKNVIDQISLQVVDFSGRQIDLRNYEMNTTILLGQNWQSGIYFLKYSSEEETGVIKLVKSK